MPGSNLVVVLGAGASYDCHIPGLTPFSNVNFRPPLTKDIFNTRPVFEEILNKYPRAQAPAADFLTKANRNPSIEIYLRKLLNRKDQISRQQLHFVTLYLQELFSQISWRYLSQEGKYTQSKNAYTILIDSIYKDFADGKISTVTFVTFNYDFILERALENHFAIGFPSINSYIEFQKSWSLVKFHGSCDWWHMLDSTKIVGAPGHQDGKEAAIHLINQNVEIVNYVEKERIVVQRGFPNRNSGNDMIPFPAMAIPVDGKYGAICPSAHLNALNSILKKEAFNLLLIGFSSRDQDFLDSFQPHWGSLRKLKIVNGRDGNEAFSCLYKSGLTGHDQNQAVSPLGFKEFVAQAEGLNAFLF